jgi:hypothetical protein
MLRQAKYFVPLGIAVFSPAVVLAKDENAHPAPKLRRAPWDVYCEPPSSSSKSGGKCNQSADASELEKCIKKCREDYVAPVKNDVVNYASQARAYFKDASDIVTENVKYLQKDASDEIRSVAIAGGGLLGFLLGVRRSFFKKLIYAAVLGSATAAVIYPKDAKIIAKEGYLYSRGLIKSAVGSLREESEEMPKKK